MDKAEELDIEVMKAEEVILRKKHLEYAKWYEKPRVYVQEAGTVEGGRRVEFKSRDDEKGGAKRVTSRHAKQYDQSSVEILESGTMAGGRSAIIASGKQERVTCWAKMITIS